MSGQIRRAHEKYGLDWGVLQNADGTWGPEQMHTVLLQEIRDSMRRIERRLDSTLGCLNFLGIPSTMKAIERVLARRLPVPKKRPRHARRSVDD